MSCSQSIVAFRVTDEILILGKDGICLESLLITERNESVQGTADPF